MNHANKTRTLRWTGVGTFGLFTADLDATIEFYQSLLDMEAGPIRGASELVTRHCFLTPSSAKEAVWVHVLEHPQAHQFSMGMPLHALENENAFAAQGGEMDTSMSICYFSLMLADQAAGEALRTRLIENGVECTRPIERGPNMEVAFRDNNGMMLSARWPQATGTVT